MFKQGDGSTPEIQKSTSALNENLIFSSSQMSFVPLSKASFKQATSSSLVQQNLPSNHPASLGHWIKFHILDFHVSNFIYKIFLLLTLWLTPPPPSSSFVIICPTPLYKYDLMTNTFSRDRMGIFLCWT